MILTKIEMAGLYIGIEHLFEQFALSSERYRYNGDYLDFSVKVSEADIENELTFYKKQMEKECQPIGDISDESLEETAIYRKIGDCLCDYGAIIYHGSAVAVNNEAVIFSATSGTGKTTHTNLWLNNIEGSYVVNGDKPIIRATDEGIFVCGTPWNGKENMGENKVVPLKAICRIIRNETNRIEPVSTAEMLSHLMSQTHFPNKPEATAKNIRILKKIADRVSFYYLYCNMEDEAANTSFNGIWKGPQ